MNCFAVSVLKGKCLHDAIESKNEIVLSVLVFF